jgi:hypothetical protein
MTAIQGYNVHGIKNFAVAYMQKKHPIKPSKKLENKLN